jgi:hypothetical protein
VTPHGLDVGVPLLAAAIGVLGGRWLERTRARNQLEMRAEERSELVRGAVRLVELELFAAEQAIAGAAREGRFSHADRPLATGAWQRHAQTLASALGVADWHRVHAAYDAIMDLNALLERHAAQFDSESRGARGHLYSSEPVTMATRDDDGVELRWRAIRTASWILRAQIGDEERVDVALADDERRAKILFGSGRSAA